MSEQQYQELAYQSAITELEAERDQLRRALATAMEELDRHQATNAAAARAFVQSEAKLNQAVEQLGYLGRLVEQLRAAAAPVATALFNISQLPLDERTRETIAQTLAPLDAVLAATRKEQSK